MRTLSFYLKVLALVTLAGFVFLANRPVVNRYPGDHLVVCSDQLSADAYQACPEGKTFS